MLPDTFSNDKRRTPSRVRLEILFLFCHNPWLQSRMTDPVRQIETRPFQPTD